MSADPAESIPFTELASGQDERVLAVLEQYLAERERGVRPDPEELAARHPELADVLRAYLSELERLQDATALPVAGPAAEGAERGRLGDFWIGREVGRGGMGVVYEAEQVSLGRRVALKVLPFAATLDSRQLQRFKNEARAAALLHHTHIVPVYAVGCDRGVHYYAMQFIEGQSLAEVIADFRRFQPGTSKEGSGGSLPNGSTPTPPVAALSTERSIKSPAFFRAVARLGAQAARALEHAHQLGVVHRDVKPANLLVDAAGQLWVTDFGLARYRAEQGLTLTGDLVGTLRYMSPEQALAKHALVDHRSDVYSLGVTLYEVLTLEPAYPGPEREELLRQIAWSEPRPPRRLNPALPPELEKVVLKAMAREPERRYATAQELADDLERFLDYRPVLAARPTLRERAARWAWRHKRVVGAAAAVFLLAVVGLLAGVVVLWREKEQTRAALAQARTNGRRAEENFRKALGGATRILVRLEDPRWDGLPRMDELRRDLVGQGLEFFREFVHEDSPDPVIRFETGRTYALMATVHCARQETGSALDFMARALHVFEDLVHSFPEELAYRRQLAATHFDRAVLYTSMGRRSEAAAEFSRVLEQDRSALPHDPGGGSLNHLAWLLANCPESDLRDPDRAVALARQAVARAPQEWAYWNTLGAAYYRAGRWREAVAALHESMQRHGGGNSYDWFFLTMATWRLGERPQARVWYDKAVTWMDGHPPADWELVRARGEAAGLLGIPEAAGKSPGRGAP